MGIMGNRFDNTLNRFDNTLKRVSPLKFKTLKIIYKIKNSKIEKFIKLCFSALTMEKKE